MVLEAFFFPCFWLLNVRFYFVKRKVNASDYAAKVFGINFFILKFCFFCFLFLLLLKSAENFNTFEVKI